MSGISIGRSLSANGRRRVNRRRSISRACRILLAVSAATAALIAAPPPRVAAAWNTEADRVVADARQHIGQHPYGFGDGTRTKGGVSPQLMNVIPAYDGVNGIDCVGFVYVVFNETHHSKPTPEYPAIVDQRRETWSLFLYSQSLGFPTWFDDSVENKSQAVLRNYAEAADIVFYKTDDGKPANSADVGHVGIYTGSGNVIQMLSTGVRETSDVVNDIHGKPYVLAAILHTGLYLPPMSDAIPAGPLTEANAVFDASGSYTPDGTGLTYHPLDHPWRAMEARTFKSQVKQTVSLAGGPVPASAGAVTGVLTASGSSTGGWVAIAPAGQLTNTHQPDYSTVTFGKGERRSNSVTIAVNAAGLDLMEWVGGSTTATVVLVFDITGYFASGSSGLGYHAFARPTRAFPEQNPIAPGVPMRWHVIDTSGPNMPVAPVAVTGVVSVYCAGTSNCVNGGYIAVAPHGALGDGSEARPYDLYFQPEESRSNSVTVKVDENGDLDFWWQPFHLPGLQAKLDFDVTGYFTDYSADQTGMTYHPFDTRVRVIDTRGHYWTSLINGYHNDVTMPADLVGAGALTGNLTVYQMACRGNVLMAAQGSLQNGQPLGSRSIALQGDLVTGVSTLRETDYTVALNQGQVDIAYERSGSYCRTD